MKIVFREHWGCLLVILVLFVILAFFRLRYPELDHGDEFSDACVLMAGINFEKFGFSTTCFLPCPNPDVKTPDELNFHYPPFSEVFNGFLRKCFGISNIWWFRAISLTVSAATCVFWYFFVFFCHKFTKMRTCGYATFSNAPSIFVRV